MVDPGSHRISSVPWYSGTCSQPLSISPKGLSPALVQLPSWVRLSTPVYFIARPTTNMEIAHHEFGLFPFRSHYWGNLIRFLFLQVLRFFNSLRSLPSIALRMAIRPSFLIRRSTGQRLLGTSPWLIAAILRLSSPPTAKASTVYP